MQVCVNPSLGYPRFVILGVFMAFTTTKYETDNGTIINVSMSEGELTAAGAAPAAAVDLNITAYNSGSKRRHGCHTRRVLLERTLGTAPDTFKKTKEITVLQKSVFDSTAYDNQTAFTIDGVAWTVSGKNGEVLT